MRKTERRVKSCGFRKWYVRSNPSYILACLEEVVVKSRLIEYVAVMRFKKLVKKSLD
jgi:hypothetical protein